VNEERRIAGKLSSSRVPAAAWAKRQRGTFRRLEPRSCSAHDASTAGTPDEVGNVAALLMGPDGSFITGSDFLMDGGVTAAYWYRDLAPS